MLTKAQTFSRLSPKATASLMYGKNLSLFSTVLRREHGAVGEAARRPWRDR
jgi:hypothetical protein